MWIEYIIDNHMIVSAFALAIALAGLVGALIGICIGKSMPRDGDQPYEINVKKPR